MRSFIKVVKMKKVLFEEKQRFPSCMHIFMFVILLVIIYIWYRRYNFEIVPIYLIFGLLPVIIVFVLFLLAGLKVKITNEEIVYRYTPFQWKMKTIKKEKVILHMNLLWLSSQEADLQTEKEFPFNHPRLVPQYKPHIPCYAESASGRIGIIIERSMPILQLVRHLQVVHFENTNLPLWTMDNPYSNPLGRISIQSSRLEKETEVEARSRTTGNQVQQSLPWVEFETSLQWWAFQRLIELLEDRGNDVFVVVGPLNEHVLTLDSILKYRELLKKAENSLEEMNLSYSLLPLLPAHLYADTSHPLPEGYSILAEHIWNRLE